MTEPENYGALLRRVTLAASWLTSPIAMRLPAGEWEAHFRDYGRDLDELRRRTAEARPAGEGVRRV